MKKKISEQEYLNQQYAKYGEANAYYYNLYFDEDKGHVIKIFNRPFAHYYKKVCNRKFRYNNENICGKSNIHKKYNEYWYIID